jgi:hypothetical protein
MVGTQTFTVVNVGRPEDHVVMQNPRRRDEWIQFPEAITVELTDINPPVLLDLVYDLQSQGMMAVAIRATRDESGRSRGLPAAITRTYAQRQVIADVMRSVGRRVRFKDVGVSVGGVTITPELAPWEALIRAQEHPHNPFGTEEIGPISRWAAEAIARGRDKTQETMLWMRARAKRAYVDATEERDDWPDLYQEVADRLGVGRTTAYRYLKDAGVIKGRSKR